MQLSLILSPYPLEFQITLCEMAYGYCLKPLIPEDSILSTYFALNYLTEAESNKTSPTRKPSTGQSSPLNRIGFTQASQSLGLPATPSPDPGPSEEKENRPDGKRNTDICLALYFVLRAAAVFISLMWLSIRLILSMRSAVS